jgi:REP element-mobilizing transposase RayT
MALDISVVMPNHIHTIVMLDDTPNMSPITLGKVVAYLKYRSTSHINDLHGTLGLRVWQRNYYEHILRDAASLSQIRTYIANNPLKWELDQLHPENPSKW